ncbi:ammonia-dependent NAD(+) synthetase [Pistricoccus aurantiacus]|uniref:ammonia-dependent NAD(+) synthetase n=1 Tax=Pistricoccus aurantiacus TaxID=1883414 RepID=UPI003630DA74
MSNQDMNYQRRIGETLGVKATMDVDQEVERRVAFLKDQVRRANMRGLVLGISGGVDSTVAGRLAQLAVEALREEGGDAWFYAMRLPYGQQADEQEARAALKFIAPDEILVTDIKPPSDTMLISLEQAGLTFASETQRDFVLGNIKARQRMIAQYAAAGAKRALVVGTDHAAEAVMGFFTKHGDGACDLTPLAGLNKRQVRELGRALGAPGQLVEKAPTADLESLQPLRTDEEALGVSYDEIDDFLMGREVSEQAYRTIVSTYERTEHKRRLPRSPLD